MPVRDWVTLSALPAMALAAAAVVTNVHGVGQGAVEQPGQPSVDRVDPCRELDR